MTVESVMIGAVSTLTIQRNELLEIIALVLPELEHINAVDKTGKFGHKYSKFCEIYNKIKE